MLVRFLKNHTPYLAGETAGFPDAQAKALIGKGVAAPAGPLSTPDGTLSDEEKTESLLAGFAQRGIAVDPAMSVPELQAMAESILANEIATRENADAPPLDATEPGADETPTDAPIQTPTGQRRTAAPRGVKPPQE